MHLHKALFLAFLGRIFCQHVLFRKWHVILMDLPLSLSGGKHLQHGTALEEASKSLCVAMYCGGKYILAFTEKHKYPVFYNIRLYILSLFLCLAEPTLKIRASSYTCLM